VRTLNYAPGPMEGEMQSTIRTQMGDKAQRDAYTAMHTQVRAPTPRRWHGADGTEGARARGGRQGKLVRMEDSAAKLVKLLKEDTFKSGSHVDYYDV
jgi:sepiapterin reductase